MYQTIIIDDEQPARLRLKRLLSNHSDKINWVAEADCGRQAIELIEQHQPNVIFLDIQMPDMTGFEVLAALTYQPLVIFTTAYEQYAIQAFENYSIDYLVKPFGAARFDKAIQKLEKFGQRSTTLDYSKLEQLVKELKPTKETTTFPVKVGDKIILIDFQNIAYFQAEDKYVRVYDKKGKSYLGDWSLGQLVEELPSNFLRVHRSYVVNKEMIGEIRKFFKGKFILTLKDEQRTSITTGGTYTDKIKKLLKL